MKKGEVLVLHFRNVSTCFLKPAGMRGAIVRDPSRPPSQHHSTQVGGSREVGADLERGGGRCEVHLN